MLKILLISFFLLAIALTGMGIRLLLDRNAKFSGGSCQAGSKELEERGITCGCGGTCVESKETQSG